MTAERIIQILIEEKKYDRQQTERLVTKIDALGDEIKEALIKWIESGELSELEYHGYTVERILKEKPTMTVLGAFLSLDWISKDPEKALKAMKQIVFPKK